MAKKSAVNHSPDQNQVEAMRHSCSHVLAQAVLEMFPEAKLAIGPTIENGFYYDFDLPRTLIPEDLVILEKKMKQIVKQNQSFEVLTKPIDTAIEFLKAADQPYKLEIAQDLKRDGETEVTFYENKLPNNGDLKFVDLCKGPHVASTGKIGAFKLTRISGAYWRGDEKNKMLQRIYGVAFSTPTELDEYLKQLEEAKKRDHRKLGPALGLFRFHDISPGSVFFFPKGAHVFNTLINFLREEYKKRGYDEVVTPLVYDKQLWETSGHWHHYKDNMFQVDMDGREASLKPMNCPSHMLMYSMDNKSYRDLPIRIADFAMLHRNEIRGALGGMTRVRKFCMDDAHLFVRDDQIEKEILECIDFVEYVYKQIFNFDYEVMLSTRPEESMGTEEQWENAEKSLENALNKVGIEYTVNPGDGAFYGPKIDFRIKDSLGREWQCATVQIDFQMPLRFGLQYEGSDGKAHTPTVIHRAILGSLERFMAILIEHYAGAFPLWLAPLQVAIIPVADVHQSYAEKIQKLLKENNIIAEIKGAELTLGKRIRESEQLKIPYMLVIGDKEKENNTLSVRSYKTKEQNDMKTEDFLEMLLQEIESKS